jgi:hypothetical protein
MPLLWGKRDRRSWCGYYRKMLVTRLPNIPAPGAGTTMWVPPLGLAGKPARPVRRRRSNGRQTTPHHSQRTGPVHRWQAPRGRDLPIAGAASVYARPAGVRQVMPVRLSPSPLTPAGNESPPAGKWEVVPGKATRAAGLPPWRFPWCLSRIAAGSSWISPVSRGAGRGCGPVAHYRRPLVLVAPEARPAGKPPFLPVAWGPWAGRRSPRHHRALSRPLAVELCPRASAGAGKAKAGAGEVGIGGTAWKP